ncbi:hypothetical protein D3C72_244930 [compost metagenome]
MLNRLVEALHERAEADWRDFIDEDGYITIRRDDVVDMALERLGVEHLYDELVNHPAVVAAVDEMKAIVRDNASDWKTMDLMYNGTMAEMLRERGMSYRDFI